MSKTQKQLIIFLLITVTGFKIPVSFGQSYVSDKSTVAQPGFAWPDGKKMALSLTFDDARLSQIDTGIPLLDKYDIKATFYISPDNMLPRIAEWKKAVNSGHEIGNHSVFHPCTGNFNWSKNKALESYSLSKMMTELDSASRFISEKTGVHPMSFAYPCGQTFVGRGINVQSYVPLIAFMFESGRGWLNEAPNDPAFCDLSQLNGTELDGKSFEQVLKYIETAKASGYWLVLAGHEMNNEGFQTSRLSTIEAICRYSANQADSIWVDTVHNIAAYVKKERAKLKLLHGE